MKDDPALTDVREAAADHLDALRGHFVGPVRMSVFVRHPNHPDGSRDVLVTDDDPAEVVAAIRRQIAIHAGPATLPEGGCRGMGGFSCLVWQREGACDHVPEHLWLHRSPEGAAEITIKPSDPSEGPEQCPESLPLVLGGIVRERGRCDFDAGHSGRHQTWTADGCAVDWSGSDVSFDESKWEVDTDRLGSGPAGAARG